MGVTWVTSNPRTETVVGFDEFEIRSVHSFVVLIMSRRHLSKKVASLAKELNTIRGSLRVISTSAVPLEPAADGTRTVMTAPKPDPAHEHAVFVPNVNVDIFGTVSVAEGVSKGAAPKEVFKNVDGQRHDDGRYQQFMKEISDFIPEKRCFTDKVRTFAYGTDASFYRLNPKLVVKVINEKEIRRILPIATKHQVPVTFRAAGTSLSGQAITDSVLLKLSHTGTNFRNYTVHVSVSSHSSVLDLVFRKMEVRLLWSRD